MIDATNLQFYVHYRETSSDRDDEGCFFNSTVLINNIIMIYTIVQFKVMEGMMTIVVVIMIHDLHAVIAHHRIVPLSKSKKAIMKGIFHTRIKKISLKIKKVIGIVEQR